MRLGDGWYWLVGRGCAGLGGEVLREGRRAALFYHKIRDVLCHPGRYIPGSPFPGPLRAHPPSFMQRARAREGMRKKIS